MRRAYNPKVPDTRANDCLEVTRRLYRVITDIAKRLDEQKGCALNVTDIFTPAGEVLRAKLKDYCERLIFKDPVGHACKTEELLWRKGFYDAVSTSKKLRKGNAWTEEEKALLSSHLAVGVGFYHHLVLKLQSECDLDLSGVIDFAYPRHKSAGLSDRKTKVSQNKLTSDEVRLCAVKIIHRSMICLGDLARYKLDFDPAWDPAIATRYYKIAVSVDPNIGMPHNQLGTMAGNRNHGIDAVYHYTRCILSAESFEGADGNLKRIIAAHTYTGREKYQYQKCAGRLFSLLQMWDSETSDSERINRHCQDLLVELEKCLSASARTDMNGVSASINDEDDIETYLQNCRNEQTCDLTDDMIFKIVAICLMSISKLKSRDSGEVQGAIAFALTILSQLVQVTVTRLQRVLVGDDVATSAIQSDSPFLENNESPELEAKTDDCVVVNGIVRVSTKSSDEDRVDLNDNERRERNVANDEKRNGVVALLPREKKFRDKSKNLLTKLRRPRKRLNSSDSEASDLDGTRMGSSSDEMNSDISETDEEEEEEEDAVLSDCNGVSDDPQSEDITDDETTKSSRRNSATPMANGHDLDTKKRKEPSETRSKVSMDDKVDSAEEERNATNSESVLTSNGTCHGEETDTSGSTSALALLVHLRKRTLGTKAILEILGGEGTLRAIKICFDWLRGNPDIFRMFAKSSGASLKRLVCLLNLVSLDDLELPFADWERDCGLISSPEKLRDSTERVPLPEDIDLRGFKLLEESHARLDWRLLRHARMSKDEETLLRARKFVEFGNYVCTIPESGIKLDEEKRIFVTSELTNATNDDQPKRINGREENEHSRGKLMRHMGRLWLKAEVRALETRLRSKLISPYLVPDHEALAKHTPALKRLVYAKKFIVIIPSVVVSALDEMKRTSSKAREATRWLEAQFRKGSRFLRAQRPHEKLPLPLIKGPRSKDKEAWLFFQIIECCHYLTQQTKVGLNGDKEPPVVTLLTGFSAEERKAAVYSPDGLSKTAGVNLEHIESFHTKWKTSSKSHG